MNVDPNWLSFLCFSATQNFAHTLEQVDEYELTEAEIHTLAENLYKDVKNIRKNKGISTP